MAHNHHRNHEHPTSAPWRVELKFEQDGSETVAVADLFVGNAEYEAHGSTHTGELDASVARQLAVARALAGLSHQLVDDASRTVGRLARSVSTAAKETADTYIVLD